MQHRALGARGAPHTWPPLRTDASPAVAAARRGGRDGDAGAPQPSQEDRALTKRLVDVGKLLGIALLDHIILGDGSEAYYSFADEQML